MAIIAQKDATTGQLVDDIADTALGLASGNWTEPQPGDVKNDQATDSWDDNGRLIHHQPSGMYVLIFIHDLFADIDSANNGPHVKGIRICSSNDWDSELDHPAGKTEVHSDDPYNSDVGFGIQQSFDYVGYTTDNNNFSESIGQGLWYIENRSGSRSTQAADPVTYFVSIGDGYINAAAWNTNDGQDGSASYLSWEHVDNKFWADGNDPWACHSQSSAGSGFGDPFRVSCYGFKYWDQNRGMNVNHPYSATGFDQGKWGLVNPDANDDTYFFQRPVAYLTNSQTVPVAFMEDVISNDIDEGGAHGDVVSHDGTDYRIFRQSGAGQNSVHSCCLRYE